MSQSKARMLSIANLEAANKRRRAIMTVSAMGIFTGLGIVTLELFVPVISISIFLTTVIVGVGFLLDSIKKIESNKKALAYHKALRALQSEGSEITKENALSSYWDNLRK